MSDKKKDIQDFLSGKESEEGKKIFETWYHSIPEKNHPELNASEETVKAALEKIKTKDIIPLNPSRNILFPYWKIAAAIAFLAVSATILLYIRQHPSPQEPLSWVEHSVPRGELLQLSLPDGSSVWLNAETEFRYPEKFDTEKREVYLKGEAFFEVTKDPSRPFRIHSGKLTTTVLGTTFNIRAYNADNVSEVAVITGKVSVVQTDSSKRLSKVTLHPGEKALLAKNTDQLSKAVFTNMLCYTAWKDGKLIFENTPVNEVITVLERYYNIDIHLKSKALQTFRVTATFDHMPLEKVMYSLCYTLHAKYSGTGNQYSIIDIKDKTKP